MSRLYCFRLTRAFTLLEMMISVVAVTFAGGAAYYLLAATLTLYAKNVSLNYSNSSLRGAIDRMQQEVNSALSIPVLIDTDGSLAATVTGPAAGFRYDKYLGGPYVVVHPGGTGIPSSATSVQVKRSTHPLASPAVPVAGDVLRINDDSSGVARPRVSSSVIGTTSSGIQTITLNFAAAIGTAVSWNSTIVKAADIVHRQAFVVFTNGLRRELRFFPHAETITNFSSATDYLVLTRDIGMEAGEETPFSIVTKDSKQFLEVALRVQSQNYGAYLASREAREFNTFLEVNTLVRPRNF